MAEIPQWHGGVRAATNENSFNEHAFAAVIIDNEQIKFEEW